MKKYIIVFLPLFAFLFFVASCSNEVAELASEDGGQEEQEEQVKTPAPDSNLYSITNEFQDHSSANNPIYIHLTSTKTQKTYIVPPTSYKSVELEFIVLDEAQVNGQCMTVPGEDFPVLVSVCQTPECTAIRSLNVVLKKPAHYNISGIGGLLVPQIYPVSPCSQEFVTLMQTVEKYEEL